MVQKVAVLSILGFRGSECSLPLGDVEEAPYEPVGGYVFRLWVFSHGKLCPGSGCSLPVFFRWTHVCDMLDAPLSSTLRVLSLEKKVFVFAGGLGQVDFRPSGCSLEI